MFGRRCSEYAGDRQQGYSVVGCGAEKWLAVGLFGYSVVGYGAEQWLAVGLFGYGIQLCGLITRNLYFSQLVN